MPSHQRNLYQPDDDENDLRQRYTTYGNDSRWNVGKDVEILRREHFWMFLVSLLSLSSLDLRAV